MNFFRDGLTVFVNCDQNQARPRLKTLYLSRGYIFGIKNAETPVKGGDSMSRISSIGIPENLVLKNKYTRLVRRVGRIVGETPCNGNSSANTMKESCELSNGCNSMCWLTEDNKKYCKHPLGYEWVQE